MKLLEFVEQCKNVTQEENPEIRIVGVGGFLNIIEILSRSAYYDENMWAGSKFEKGNFACVETEGN